MGVSGALEHAPSLFDRRPNSPNYMPTAGPVVPGVMSPGVLMPVVVVPGSAVVVPPRGAKELVPELFREGNAPNGLYVGDPGERNAPPRP